MANLRICSYVVAFALLFCASTNAQLSTTFYDRSCPQFPVLVRQVMNATIAGSPRMGASILRLFFHDCFVNGCDGSILLDDTVTFKGEKTTPPNNNSARGFEVINNIKSKVEVCCEGVVSCADIIALAARDSVALLGGPFYEVPLGRRDARTTSLNSTNGIPAPFFNLSQLISSFGAKGLNARDLTALSGAHSIGFARCATFRDHIHNDTNIDKTFAANLMVTCPRFGLDRVLAPLDAQTAIKFDNSYYSNLVGHRGLLHSDQELYNNGPLDELVEVYAQDNNLFKRDFAIGVVKMGNINPLTGSNGEIRKQCGKPN